MNQRASLLGTPAQQDGAASGETLKQQQQQQHQQHHQQQQYDRATITASDAANNDNRKRKLQENDETIIEFEKRRQRRRPIPILPAVQEMDEFERKAIACKPYVYSMEDEECLRKRREELRIERVQALRRQADAGENERPVRNAAALRRAVVENGYMQAPGTAPLMASAVLAKGTASSEFGATGRFKNDILTHVMKLGKDEISQDLTLIQNSRSSAKRSRKK